MSTFRMANIGPLNGNTAAVVDPATPAGGSAAFGPLVSFAAATATGTYVDFTGIPPWVKRITAYYSGWSLSTNAQSMIQLGTASGIVNSGYNTNYEYLYGGSSSGAAYATTGFVILNQNAANFLTGTYTFYLLSSNIWVGSGVQSWDNANNYAGFGAGKSPDLGSRLTFVRFCASDGNAMDGGTLNIMYE